MKTYKIAVVGATGMVGRTFLKVLEEKCFPNCEYTLFSSARSAGKEIDFMGEKYICRELTETSFNEGFDIALFSAGGATSAKFAPIAAAKGCVVIDNSSHFRMDESVPLIVPEVNPEALAQHKGIIANPNCSTIQAMVALAPLHKKYGIRRIIYSTYQAVSGAGVEGVRDLERTAKGEAPEKWPHSIYNNCLPHIDVFLDNGYTKEEQKMIDETHKILGDKSIGVTATTVRVPILNSHSESINIELARKFEVEDIKELLKNSDGITLYDDVENNIYPLATIATDSDSTFVGRIRRDFSQPRTLNMWVVADNIRKGAATNAVQIAELLIAK
ncbi:MAG: aspartate-semialdehyde dehydrogenase [Oscillospiraceae bacterium]|nr:aspartate-semialdehyde dehydrogenase [Oscillospiraceae bacterium]